MKDIKARKFTLVEKLISVSDEHIIQYLEQFFKGLETKEEEQSFPPLTPSEIQGIKDALNEPEEDAIDEDLVKKRFQKWLK